MIFSDDYFTLRNYEIMFGHRPEDPDRYEALLAFIKKVLLEIHGKPASHPPPNGTIQRGIPTWTVG